MRTIAIVLALVSATQPTTTRVGTPFDARVVLVADGDTLELIPAGETVRIRVRLEGIDAPEFGEPFSRQATTFTRTMLLKQHVRVEGRDVDRYGRLVARVSAAGRDTSLALVQAGLACHFTQFANDAVLADAQSRARAAGAGFWAANAPKPQCARRAPRNPGASASARREPPAGYGPPPLARDSASFGEVSQKPPSAAKADETSATRRDGREGAPGFRGNVSSRLYHASSCRNANCRNCTRLFTTEGEAKLAGFSPAGDCVGRRR